MKRQGFTLIEVLLVNAIVAIVLISITVIWQMIVNNYNFSMSQFQLTEDVNLAVRQLETELRQAEEAMQGAYPLSVMDDYQIAFYADIDNNSTIEKIRYWVDSGKLQRGVIEPTGNPPTYQASTEKVRMIATNVITTSPLFTYYNDAWPQDVINNPLSVPLRPLHTRLVKITIPIQLQSDQLQASHSAEAIVQIRNLKSNL